MTNFQEDFKYDLSVIICAYNEETHLLNCLNSIKNQKYNKSKFEVIIMDNESNDKTPEIAKEFTKLNRDFMNVRYYRIKHVGLSISRNSGISLAQGKIISFVDGDAIAHEDCVKNILEPFKLDHKTSIVCGKVKNLDNGSFFSKFIFHSHFNGGVKSRNNNPLGSLVGANMAFSRDVFEVTGGFFNGFTLYGDESSVALKYLLCKPNAIIRSADKAIVYNEHPDRLALWLKQRFFQGKMLFLINAHIERSNKFKLFLKALIKSLGLLSLVIILLNFVITLPLIVFFVSFLFFAIVTFARYKYILNAFNEVSKAINFKSGLVSIVVCIIGSIFSDAGYFVEGIMSFSKRQINLNNSVSSIVERV
ncbi:glycosyltransferase [Gammaproteobacteria bacterium]|nr:glycosyltransferase [Gammaproteobacteria bacterium]